ncbi:MAG TPA: hypothetical protein EYO33_20755 [Phycisphaerales bacterium]|nr:hypothetical protein [Phycisphaerales bacterium]
METLEVFLREYRKFLEYGIDQTNMQHERSALETRAVALVLSGAIPPYVNLVETVKDIELVLNNPASLLPSKGTDDGLKCLETGSITSSGADGKLGGEGGDRESGRTTFLERSS